MQFDHIKLDMMFTYSVMSDDRVAVAASLQKLWIGCWSSNNPWWWVRNQLAKGSVWGPHTPQMMLTSLECLLPQRTSCKGELFTSNVTPSCSCKISWSMVSNALERSTKTSKAESPRTTASRRYTRTQIVAVLVKWPHQYKWLMIVEVRYKLPGDYRRSSSLIGPSLMSC